MTGMPNLAVTPPAIAQRQSADWGLLQPEQVDVIRHESFDYEFKGSRHLLIASERAERLDGETLLDGLPRSTRREWNRKMTFVPAGHRFYGWQKPRSLLRSTFLYIDPRSSLLSELRFAEVEFRPRLFFFDSDVWATALKLKAQLQHPCRSQSAYVEALCIALAHELMRMNEGGSSVEANMRGGLPGWQQKKVARRRIDRAKVLLAERKLSVTEIGLDVGFSETSSFTSAFRKVTGETPTEYRRTLA